MEGVGARLGRSSTRYGPATVFTGPVRKWKKKWIHVTPPNAVVSTPHTSSNNNQQTVGMNSSNSSSNGNGNGNGNGNENGSHILLYKWTPISQSQSQNGSNGDVKDEGADGDDDVEPPRRKMKYIPIALLEEQKKESPEEEHIDDSIETDPDSKVDHVNGKPDINDVPMEENQVSEETNVGRQDLNKSTLDLNARDGDEDTEEMKDEAQ